MGLPASVPVQIRAFLNVLWVWVKGDRPTFISKAQLKRHFVERRQAAAQGLEVRNELCTPVCYTVTDPQSGSHHRATEHAGWLACDCEDYYWQQRFIGRGCCKHGYAVLNYLGFDSLKSFVAATEQAAQPRPTQQA